jgi:hypothetical protein
MKVERGREERLTGRISKDSEGRDGDLLENHSFQDLNLPNYQYLTKCVEEDEG